MIDTEMYDPIIEKIKVEIDRANIEQQIIVKSEKEQAIFTKSLASFMYKSSVLELDINASESQEQIIFSEKFISLEEHYYGLVELTYKQPLSPKVISENITAAKAELEVPVFLCGLIENKLHELPSILTEEINKLKNSPRFPCCEDVNIIIQHLIDHYNAIINAPDKQINYFVFEIQLNKRLSDLITLAVIQTLQKVLEMRQHTTSNSHIKDLPKQDHAITKHKLIWQGKQIELLELIVTLQTKGWIAKIPVGSLSKAAREITSLFDLTGADKSFAQILKGKIIDGERTYDSTYGKRYKEKFDKIESNKR